MTEFSGQADADRILPLLWRNTAPAAAGSPVGRPPRLTVDEVVAAAIAFADAEGLTAMSMARVATALGVGTMTLYGYVPSRVELIDLMVDDVLAGHRLPGPGEPRPQDWRAQIELYDRRTRAMYETHPWLGEISTIRPPNGPGMLAESEYVLSTVAGLGLPAQLVNAAAVAVTGMVVGAARQAAEDIRLRRSTGESTDAWWGRQSRLWEDYFDPDRYPTMNRLWHDGGYDADAGQQATRGHTFGLTALLDGIEAAARRTGAAG